MECEQFRVQDESRSVSCLEEVTCAASTLVILRLWQHPAGVGLASRSAFGLDHLSAGVVQSIAFHSVTIQS
jgi:hypothetical protein